MFLNKKDPIKKLVELRIKLTAKVSLVKRPVLKNQWDRPAGKKTEVTKDIIMKKILNRSYQIWPIKQSLSNRSYQT